MKPISWRKKMKFKKLLLLITFLFITATAIGATLEGVTFTGVSYDAIPVGGGGGGSCSYVHCNGFEEQSDDDDWTTVSGTPDFDNVWVIEGSESLEFPTGNNAAVSIAVTAREETWITFMLRFNDNNESTETLVLLYNDSTLLGSLLSEHDAFMKVQAEGGTLSGGETVGVYASTYYIKLRFKQGTGANAELEFWACTDGTTWIKNISSTDGTSTAQVNKIVFQNTYSNEIMRLDNFMENSADIADAT